MFGGAKDFAQIPKTFPKETKKVTSKNDCTSFHFGRIFSNQSASGTIFAQISPNLPKFPLTCLKKN